jgi:hypothetical protein
MRCGCSRLLQCAAVLASTGCVHSALFSLDNLTLGDGAALFIPRFGGDMDGGVVALDLMARSQPAAVLPTIGAAVLNASEFHALTRHGSACPMPDHAHWTTGVCFYCNDALQLLQSTHTLGSGTRHWARQFSVPGPGTCKFALASCKFVLLTHAVTPFADHLALFNCNRTNAANVSLLGSVHFTESGGGEFFENVVPLLPMYAAFVGLSALLTGAWAFKYFDFSPSRLQTAIFASLILKTVQLTFSFAYYLRAESTDGNIFVLSTNTPMSLFHQAVELLIQVLLICLQVLLLILVVKFRFFCCSYVLEPGCSSVAFQTTARMLFAATSVAS